MVHIIVNVIQPPGELIDLVEAEELPAGGFGEPAKVPFVAVQIGQLYFGRRARGRGDGGTG